MATLPLDVAGSDEQVEEIQIETPDYTDYELLNPGVYTSPSRTVVPERRTTTAGGAFVMARVEIPELIAEDGTKVFLSRPLVKYIFSFTRKQKNRQGETSDIAKYLRAAGITLEGTVNPELLQNALSESAASPVKVRVGWTNRTPKDASGEYLKERAYTGDFKKGETLSSTITADEIVEFDNPKKVERLQAVLVNGRVQAKHRVEEFYKI